MTDNHRIKEKIYLETAYSRITFKPIALINTVFQINRVDKGH